MSNIYDKLLLPMRALVKDVLDHAQCFEWQVQGLGMLRTYVDRSTRIHVWDDDLKVPDVSDIHDHPFDFTSFVMSGTLTNLIFHENPSDFGDEFSRVRIVCGVGDPTAPERVDLSRKPLDDRYTAGQVYSQTASEIHRTLPSDGCVTLVCRTFIPVLGDMAHVYFQTPEWVTAVPRPATRAEVCSSVAKALARWDDVKLADRWETRR